MIKHKWTGEYRPTWWDDGTFRATERQAQCNTALRTFHNVVKDWRHVTCKNCLRTRKSK